MKKLISLMLAVSMMLASTCAFAALDPNRNLAASNQRNPGGFSDVTGGRNSNVLRNYSNNLKHLAVYRPGDTITFTEGNATNLISTGDVVTLISSKLGEDLSNATVMFVDQIVADTDNPTFNYVVRNLPEGVYRLDIKMGDAAADTFYYGVAKPDVQIAAIDANGTQAYVDGDKAQYFGHAAIGGGFMFEQAGVAAFGFDFGNDNVATTPAAAFDDAEKNEIGGVADWWFTMVLTDIEGAAPAVEAAVVNE